MDKQTPTQSREFWAGVKATFPLVVGAAPFGIIFGAVAGSRGLSVGGTVAMSAFVFAGTAQLIATTLIANGASTALIILTTFVVNFRHSLYAVTLGPHLKHLPQRWLFPLGFWLTDESFVVVVLRFSQPDGSPFQHWYFLGSNLFMFSNWQLCTWIGIFAGQRIQNPQNLGLDFALVATFIGILMPTVKSRAALVSVIVAGLTAVLCNWLPNQLGLFVAALLGVVAGLAAESVWPVERAARTPPEAISANAMETQGRE